MCANNVLFSYDLELSTWTQIQNNIGSPELKYQPWVYRGKVYTFPYKCHEESLWLGDGEESLASTVTIYDLQTQDTEALPSIDRVEFGPITVCNGKVYTINTVNDFFVETSMDDLKEFNVLGKIGKSGVCAPLVALPSYPDFKCGK